MNPCPNQNQGPIVSTISANPRTQDVDVVVITHGGATTREDSPIPQICIVGKKKVQFDIDVEKVLSGILHILRTEAVPLV